MRFLLLLSVSFFMVIISVGLWGQAPEWKDPNSLPPWLTFQEKQKLHEIGKSFQPTLPPQGEIRSIAEYERMQGVLIRYPLGIPLALVQAMSQHVTVYTIVGSIDMQNQAIGLYQDAGINMENCRFVIAPTNSYWTRDYGPWFIAIDNEQVGIVDFIYNRPRPDDDAIPLVMSGFLNIPRYAMDIVHTGGNYMTDGNGIAASTDLVLEENLSTQVSVLQTMENYLGIDTYHITIDPQNTYLKHIDTWAKFLDTDKILIARVNPGHPQYTAHEEVAAYFAQQTSAFGTPYQVYRVDTPSGQPYTNSLILNKTVYVPVTGSSLDAAALAVYQEAMPGYEVLGFTGSWYSTDALHCRVKGVADIGMLHIAHMPLTGDLPYQPFYEIQADIVAFSQEELYSDSLFIIYKRNQEEFDTIPLLNIAGDTFGGQIPSMPGDTLMSYYLWAADASGRRETFPFAAPAATRTFRIVPESFTIIEAKIFLEGPYLQQEEKMATHLNDLGYLPVQHPYGGTPWYYDGQEQVTQIPSENIVDWVLLSFRRSSDAENASFETTVKTMAAFLLEDGRVVDLDGESPITIDIELSNDLFMVIHHRNHLDIMSAQPLEETNGVASIDFTNSPQLAYSISAEWALNHLGGGIYGMFGGDGDGNGQIQIQDKNEVWEPQSGNSGYFSGDFRMNGLVQTQDKNDIWERNSGIGSMIP